MPEADKARRRGLNSNISLRLAVPGTENQLAAFQDLAIWLRPGGMALAPSRGPSAGPCPAQRCVLVQRGGNGVVLTDRVDYKRVQCPSRPRRDVWAARLWGGAGRSPMAIPGSCFADAGLGEGLSNTGAPSDPSWSCQRGPGDPQRDAADVFRRVRPSVRGDLRRPLSALVAHDAASA